MADTAKSNEIIVKRITLTGFVLNIVLAAVKIVAGHLGHSHTVIADGIHSLSDSVTDVAVIVGSSLWSAPPDEGHPHGHSRIEAFVTTIIGLSLLFVAYEIGSHAVLTFSEPDEIPTWIAFAAALLSIFVKEILYRFTASYASRVKSSAMLANAWHHRIDAISSIPAAMAVVAAIILTEYGFIDNIGALIVSLFIAYTAFKISWSAIMELTDSGADRTICESVECAAKGVDGVKSIHKCRTRKYGNGIQVDLHIQVDPDITVREGHKIGHKVEDELFKNHDVIDVVVHVEPYEEC